MNTVEEISCEVVNGLFDRIDDENLDAFVSLSVIGVQGSAIYDILAEIEAINCLAASSHSFPTEKKKNDHINLSTIIINTVDDLLRILKECRQFQYSTSHFPV